MATGEQSGKRKSKKRAPGHSALLIAEQVDFIREQLVGFKTAYDIRKMLFERWGLEEATANNRIKLAREAIRDDVARIDRQELAAMMTDMATKIAEESVATRQMSNAIGAMRLLGELGGLTGQNKL